MKPTRLHMSVLALVTCLAAPAVLADHGHRDSRHETRSHHSGHEYSRHEYQGHQDRREYRDDRQQRGRDVHARYRHHHADTYYRPVVVHYHTPYYYDASAPVILGGVIGGAIGREIGRGDPGHTAAGAVIGTIIGYDIARHRDW